MKKTLLFLLVLSFVMPLRAHDLTGCTDATDSILALVPYQDTMRWGYTHECTANERKLYDMTVNSFQWFEANGVANGWIENRAFVYPGQGGIAKPGITDYMYLVNRMMADMPELYILNSYIPRNTTDGTGFYIRINKIYTPSQYAAEMAQIDHVVDSIIAALTPQMSDYEKIVALHDAICRVTRYGGMSSAYAGCLKGVFIDHRAVCEGWSRSLLYLCQRAKIPCLYVTGAINKNPGDSVPDWGSHAWNFIQLHGQWYLVDATTDGALGGCGRTALLKGQAYFDANYTFLFNGTGSNENAIPYPHLPALAPSDFDPNAPITTQLPSPPDDAAAQEAVCEKFWHDGRLLIRRGAHVFDALGHRVE